MAPDGVENHDRDLGSAEQAEASELHEFRPVSADGSTSRYFAPPAAGIDGNAINLSKPARPIRLFWVTSIRDVGGDDGVNLQWDKTDATSLLKGSLHSFINAMNDELKGYVEIVGVAVDDIPGLDDEKLKFDDPDSDVSATYSILPQPEPANDGKTWITPYNLINDHLGIGRVYHIPSSFRSIKVPKDAPEHEKIALRQARKAQKYDFERQIAERAKECGADIIHSDHLMVVFEHLFKDPELGFQGRITNQHPGIAYKKDPDRLPGATPTLDALVRYQQDKSKNRTGAAFHFMNEEVDGGENIFDTASTPIHPDYTRQDVRRGNYQESKNKGLVAGVKFLAANFEALVNGNLKTLGIDARVEPLAPVATHKEITLEFIGPNEANAGYNIAGAKTKPADKLYQLVTANANLRGWDAPNRTAFNKILKNGGHPLQYQIIYERQEGKAEPRAIGYVSYSSSLDRKGRPAAIIHEMFTVNGRTMPEITEAMLGKVAAETQAEKLILGISNDDHLGQKYLEHAIGLGAVQPDGVISLDPSNYVHNMKQESTAYSRPMEERDLDMLKDFKTSSGEPLLNENFNPQNLTSADVKATIIITFEDSSERRPIAVTAVNRDLSLMNAAETIEIEHIRSPNDASPYDRMGVIPSVLGQIRTDRVKSDLGITGNTGALRYRWNIAQTGSDMQFDGTKIRRPSHYHQLLTGNYFHFRETEPPRQMTVLSNGKVQSLRERWGTKSRKISIPESPVRLAAVPYGSDEPTGGSGGANGNGGGDSQMTMGQIMGPRSAFYGNRSPGSAASTPNTQANALKL